MPLHTLKIKKQSDHLFQYNIISAFTGTRLHSFQLISISLKTFLRFSLNTEIMYLLLYCFQCFCDYIFTVTLFNLFQYNCFSVFQ